MTTTTKGSKRAARPAKVHENKLLSLFALVNELQGEKVKLKSKAFEYLALQKKVQDAAQVGDDEQRAEEERLREEGEQLKVDKQKLKARVANLSKELAHFVKELSGITKE